MSMVVVCVFASSWTARVAGDRQKVWLESLQSRLQFTFPAVSSIREVKMLDLSGHVRTKISQSRKDEVDSARWFRHIIVISFVLGESSNAGFHKMNTN